MGGSSTLERIPPPLHIRKLDNDVGVTLLVDVVLFSEHPRVDGDRSHLISKAKKHGDAAVNEKIAGARLNRSAVVDTAAQISMIGLHVLKELNIDRDSLRKTIKLKNAQNDSVMNCLLIPDFEFILGGKSYIHTVAAGPITDDFILGLDFWLKHQGVVNLPQQFIQVDGNRLDIRMVKSFAGQWYNLSQVTVCNDTKVEPQCKSIVKVKLSSNARTSFVTAPICTDTLLGPAGIVNNNGICGVEVINDSNNTVMLRRGEIITTATELDENSVAAEPAVRKIQVKVSNNLDNSGTIQIETYLADSSWDNNMLQTELKEAIKALPSHVTKLFEETCTNLQDHEKYAVAKLLTDYGDTFAKSDEDLGRFDLLTHKIQTTDEVPVQARLRRTPLKFVAEEEDALQKMLDGGVIRPSCSDWSSAPVLVRKKDGSVRYAIDYRKLNAKTIKDNYPLPLIAECLDALQGSLWFHGLDLASGYWQVGLDPKDAEKTAFVTKYGLYEYTRMPFGLCNAPATFQRVMHLVLRGLVWKQVLVYLDDVVVLGSTFTEALANLQETLERFRRHNLKLKPKKCQLFRKEVKFLGRVVSGDGVKVSEEHINCIKDWPTPTNQTEIAKFLGFINYHREFIPQLSRKAEPLFSLTKKGKKFEWNEKCVQAFQQLKEDITSPPVLSLPNDQDPYILDTDASDFAIGAALYQVRDGKECPVSFASQTLTPAQRRYCTTRKELLSIVVFTRQFRHYLLGRSFTVRTDHGSLAWLYRFKEPTGQLGRWLEELGQFDMTIQHRPGVRHSNADALSRIPAPGPVCKCYEAGRKLQDLPCHGCKYCTRLHQQWERFQDEVDYVVPLAVREISVTAAETAAETDTSSFTWAGYSDQEIRQLQLEDESLATLMEWLKNGSPEEAELFSQSAETKSLWRCKDQLKLIDDLLYYNWVGDSFQSSCKLIIPAKLRDQVIGMAHDGTVGGHWGREKTLARLRHRFFWPSMDKDVRLYIGTCSNCNTNKNQRKNRSPMISYQAGNPNERVHLDFLGPFNESLKGNKYILSIVDQFTKWIEIYPLPDQSAAATAHTFFEGWICRFGVPSQVHTDQGRNFTSNLFHDLCKLLEATKTRTTPYRPSSNGQVERYNQMILSYIRCQLEGDDRRWDENLAAFGLSLRSTVNRNTGFTPNMMQLGREVQLPVDILFGLRSKLKMEESTSDYVKKVDKTMREVFHLARSTLQSAQKRQKCEYDNRSARREARYEVGDLVYTINSSTQVGHSTKLQPVMTGPFIVCKVISTCLYGIRGRRRTTVMHHDRLRLCEDRSVPLWVRRVRDEVLGNKTNDEEEVNTQEEEAPLNFLFEDRNPTYEETEGADIDPSHVISEIISEQDDADDVEENSVLPKTSSRGRIIRRPKRFDD